MWRPKIKYETVGVRTTNVARVHYFYTKKLIPP